MIVREIFKAVFMVLIVACLLGLGSASVESRWLAFACALLAANCLIQIWR